MINNKYMRQYDVRQIIRTRIYLLQFSQICLIVRSDALSTVRGLLPASRDASLSGFAAGQGDAGNESNVPQERDHAIRVFRRLGAASYRHGLADSGVAAGRRQEIVPP